MPGSLPRVPLVPGAVMLAVFVSLFCLIGRMSLPVEGAPAFYVEKGNGAWVELGRGFQVSGLCQYFDEESPAAVVKMTLGRSVPAELLLDPEWTRPLTSGERLEIWYESAQIAGLKRSWMSAAARMTLSIPLNPDHMTLADWPALPGIGPRLAERIEHYRQKNGDFGRLDALSDVPGIGYGRISSWREFF